MEQELPRIYDEGETPSHTPFTLAKATSPPSFQEGFLFSQATTKNWSAPILPREKLVETLNILEQEHCEIFTILTVSIALVQVVYFQDKT